ncbi:MAG: DNA mismatch repair endonuclease MutL [Clostridia bacterium]|nr:DNA mismatch repair endonuclease MutL [Clostridia bacterium]
MGRINVLGFEVANLIAAGEVVDRPSSVIKELVENSIDAGATSLTIEIKNGGKTFMRVSDNGGGIEFSELPVAILRHATSKIKDASDLDSIMTLGFRGEALAAISSVSRLRIMSKTRDSELGGFLECHAGEVVSHIHTGCADGTTIIVEDLFYNVPARKKFLKADKTETGTITATVEKIALSKPEISFRYIVDGETKFVTGGDGELLNTIYAVLGRDFAKKVIKVDRDENGIKISGYISTPELVRANRNLETFYINSRFVKSKTMGAALEQAYQSYIPSDKFPFCVLNLEINPSLVDVNVHPAKLEVKFSNESIIFSSIYYAVRGALATSVTRPELYEEKREEIPVSETPFPVNDRNAPKPQRIVFDSNTNTGILRQDSTLEYDLPNGESPAQKYKTTTPSIFDDIPTEPPLTRSQENDTPDAVTPPQPTPEAELEEAIIPSTEIASTAEKRVVPDYKIIGEAFNSYVIVELGDIMYLIDKHAAHERIIFEDLKKKLTVSEPSSQMLMIPLEVYLTSDEIGALNEFELEIRGVGFSYEINGSRVNVLEIPSEIELSGAQDALIALVSRLSSGEGSAEVSRQERLERALYQASCKAAIKAGRIYDQAHIKWICDRVLTLDNIKYCPHGRPIAFEITKHFLERQFERIK